MSRNLLDIGERNRHMEEGFGEEQPDEPSGQGVLPHRQRPRPPPLHHASTEEARVNMNDNDIQAAATILGSMIVSNHPKVSANKIVSADVEWSVFAGMCIDLAEAISHEKHSRTTSGTKRR